MKRNKNKLLFKYKSSLVVITTTTNYSVIRYGRKKRKKFFCYYITFYKVVFCNFYCNGFGQTINIIIIITGILPHGLEAI